MKKVSQVTAMDTSDLSDIKSTIGHHDARIEDLGRRIGGVEHVVRSLSGEVSKGFSDLAAKLNGLESSKGPGFGKVIGVAVGCATLMVIVCGFVSFMVVSYVSPETTKLSLEGNHRQYIIGKLDTERDEELRRLREEKDDRTELRLKTIESALGWIPKEVLRLK